MDIDSNKVKERFWNKVDKSGNCWLWTGFAAPKVGNRYGIVKIKGRFRKAHRVSFAWSIGDDLDAIDGVKISHTCTDTLCVNPSHLIIVIWKDRFWSKVRKHGNDDCWPWVGAITFLIDGKLHLPTRVSKALEMNLSNPSKISRTFWVVRNCCNTLCVNPKHLFLKKADGNAKLSKSDVREMRKLSAIYSKKKLADIFHVAANTVGDIVNRRTWKDVD